MRRVGIEEHRVAGLRRHRAAAEAPHVVVGEGLPLLPEQPAGVVAGAQLQAAVLCGGGVDAEHGGHEQIGVGAPAGLLILVGLEAVAAGKLEVDLVLEEHGGLVEEPCHGAAELLAVAQFSEPVVERAEVLDPLQHALARAEEARLEVLHGSTRLVRAALEVVRPVRDPARFPPRRTARGRPRSRRAGTPPAAPPRDRTRTSAPVGGSPHGSIPHQPPVVGWDVCASLLRRTGYCKYF